MLDWWWSKVLVTCCSHCLTLTYVDTQDASTPTLEHYYPKSILPQSISTSFNKGRHLYHFRLSKELTQGCTKLCWRSCLGNILCEGRLLVRLLMRHRCRPRLRSSAVFNFHTLHVYINFSVLQGMMQPRVTSSGNFFKHAISCLENRAA